MVSVRVRHRRILVTKRDGCYSGGQHNFFAVCCFCGLWSSVCMFALGCVESCGFDGGTTSHTKQYPRRDSYNLPTVNRYGSCYFTSSLSRCHTC